MQAFTVWTYTMQTTTDKGTTLFLRIIRIFSIIFSKKYYNSVNEILKETQAHSCFHWIWFHPYIYSGVNSHWQASTCHSETRKTKRLHLLANSNKGIQDWVSCKMARHFLQWIYFRDGLLLVEPDAWNKWIWVSLFSFVIISWKHSSRQYCMLHYCCFACNTLLVSHRVIYMNSTVGMNNCYAYSTAYITYSTWPFVPREKPCCSKRPQNLSLPALFWRRF